MVVDGQADFEVVGVSSRLSTLDTLGSYRMSVTGDAANPGISNLLLSTQDGALQLSGTGTVGPAGLRFRGEARASGTEEAALSEPAEHHRAARRRAVRHFDRMSMKPSATFSPRGRMLPAAVAAAMLCAFRCCPRLARSRKAAARARKRRRSRSRSTSSTPTSKAWRARCRRS